MAIKIPSNISNVKSKIVALKDVDNLSKDNYSNLFNKAENYASDYAKNEFELSSISDQLDNKKLNELLDPSNIDFNQLMVDGEDAIALAVNEISTAVSGEIVDELNKLDTESTDLKNQLANGDYKTLLSSNKAKQIMSSSGYSIKTSDIEQIVEKTQDVQDIESLEKELEKQYSDMQKKTIDLQKIAMTLVNAKSKIVNAKVGSLASKFDTLAEGVSNIDLEQITISDLNDKLVEPGKDLFEDATKDSMFNLGLKKGMTQLGISSSIQNEILKNNDINQLKDTVKQVGGPDIGNATIGYDITVIPGVVPYDDCSKISKAISGQTTSTDSIVNNSGPFSKVYNGSKNIRKDINDAIKFVREI